VRPIVRDDIEPVSPTREPPENPRQTERGALRDALTAAAFFGGIVLLGGILAILFIALLQSLGLWGAPA
jgi:hypothetical protein